MLCLCLKLVINQYFPITDLFLFYLPFLKSWKKIVYNRLISFLSKHKTLSYNQFGFRKHHSTEYVLALLYDKISSAVDNNEVTGGIFIDLSKACDTVNHQILLDKFQHYGICGVAFNLFSDYLKNRQQFVQFNDIHSSRHYIKCGVPQGSILGPLLFLIYSSDMCYVSKVLDFILFADDTNIFFSHKNVNVIEKTPNDELPNLTDWCQANRISINFKKIYFYGF